MTSTLFSCGQFWCGHSGAERWYKIWGIWKKLGLLTIFFLIFTKGKLTIRYVPVDIDYSLRIDNVNSHYNLNDNLIIILINDDFIIYHFYPAGIYLFKVR